MHLEAIMSVMLGIGLAAACGFRVFVPLLALSLAAQRGHLELASHFSWLASEPALWCFGVATALELAGYYIPWVDHLLDTLATPAAVAAGTLVTAAVLIDMSPWVQWTLALIAGGGVAGVVQGGTVVTRLASTTATGGLANPLVASAEMAMSGTLSLLAIVVPWLSMAMVAAVLLWIGWRIRQRRGNRDTASPVA